MKKFLSAVMVTVVFLIFSISASAQTTSDLTSSQAIKLALSAHQHYWNTMNGHIPKVVNSKCLSKIFIYKGTEYRYFCSELGTKEKLVKYLNEVFTLNAINKGIKKYRFIEYRGKLAQPNADGGSLLQWNKAKAKLIYQRKDIRLYEFSVPYGNPVKYEKRKVTFVKVRNKCI
jgi:iseA protein